MPRANTSTFIAECVDIVLVPLDDAALGHGGVFNGNQLVEPAAAHDKAAYVLHRWRIHQLLGQDQPFFDAWAVRVEPDGDKTFRQLFALVPPAERRSQGIDAVGCRCRVLGHYRAGPRRM